MIDAVDGSTLERSWNILALRGRLVTIAAGSETAADELAKRAFFNVQPNAEQLENIPPSENGWFHKLSQKMAELPTRHEIRTANLATSS